MDMNLKTLLAGALTASAVTIGSMFTASPIQAAELAPGTFLLIGETSITDEDPFNTSDGFILNFEDMGIVSSQSEGVFEGLNGIPTVSSLFLTPNPSDAMLFSAVVNDGGNTFITGLELADGTDITVTLTSGTFEGTVDSSTDYDLGGTFVGEVLDSDGNVRASGNFSALLAPQGFGFSTVGVRTVPTPAAVLPGLIGMGTAVFRKKKQEEEPELVAENA